MTATIILTNESTRVCNDLYDYERYNNKNKKIKNKSSVRDIS